MSQTYTNAKAAFLARLGAAISDQIRLANIFTGLANEWTAAQYATGAGGDGNAANMTDDDVQAVYPAGTALLLNEAMGAISGSGGIVPTVEANLGYMVFLKQ